MNKKTVVVSIAAIAIGSFVLNLAVANFFLSKKSLSDDNMQQSNKPKIGAVASTGQKLPSVPKDTCGDSYDSSASAWYPVLLDGSNVNTVRNTLCRDARDVTRKDTGKQSVQVASFTSYERAWNYAKLINASVGQPTNVDKELPDDTPTTYSPSPILRSINPAFGLNISRQRVQEVFEKPEVGFRFEDSPLKDGRQRVIGNDSRGMALVELIGAPDNLTQALVITGMTKDDVATNQLSAIYILGMLNLVLPDWDGAESWITESVTQFAETDLSEASTMQYGKRIKLKVDKKLGLITLVISPNQ